MPALWVHWESNPVHPLKRRVLYLRAMDPIDRAPPFKRERGSPLLFAMSKNYRSYEAGEGNRTLDLLDGNQVLYL